jgi:hypothetical protein
MPRIVPSQVRRFIASIPLIVLVAPLSSALAQQKTAAPPRPSQAQLEDRVKQLETRLVDAEQKAASAAMEKDYITRVQKLSLFSLRSPRAEARGYHVSFRGASGFGMTTAVAENREQRRPLRTLQLAKGCRKQAGQRIFAWASE